ncbi:MAG TPA: NADH-quinone oxidoreductase subunit L, partial [Pilimelia sp.]|nr:NADH-quinone oxidoreductase subunit L [Pilimelia sp.]
AQRALVVRPVTALARAVRSADEVGVAGAVAGVGRAVSAAAGWVAARHAGALPRAVTIALGGALLAGFAAAALSGVAR